MIFQNSMKYLINAISGSEVKSKRLNFAAAAIHPMDLSIIQAGTPQFDPNIKERSVMPRHELASYHQAVGALP